MTPASLARGANGGLRVRGATASDEPWLTRIDYDAWTPRPDRPRLEPASTLFFARSHGGTEGDVLVATLPEAVVGFIVSIDDAPAGSPTTSRIVEIAVDAMAQRRRVGTSLLLAAVLGARRSGITRATALVPRTNTATTALLTAAGFRSDDGVSRAARTHPDEGYFSLATSATGRLVSRVSGAEH